MNNRWPVAHTILLVLILIVSVVTALAVLPAPRASTPIPAQQAQPKAAPTEVGASSTNFTDLSVAKLNVTTQLDAAALTVGGYTSSGAVRFGAASNVVSGTLIAHGFTVTPTSILLQPLVASGSFTQSFTIMASNATSFTVGIGTGSVTTITTMYWMAGK